jgi:hypothetical protein
MGIDGTKDLHSLADMGVGGTREGEESSVLRRRVRGLQGAELRLVKIGLKSSLDDVKGTGKGSCRHTTKPACGQHEGVIALPESGYPPATKCAHGFAKGSALVIGASSSVAVGTTAPVSLGCGEYI